MKLTNSKWPVNFLCSFFLKFWYSNAYQRPHVGSLFCILPSYHPKCQKIQMFVVPTLNCSSVKSWNSLLPLTKAVIFLLSILVFSITILRITFLSGYLVNLETSSLTSKSLFWPFYFAYQLTSFQLHEKIHFHSQ